METKHIHICTNEHSAYTCDGSGSGYTCTLYIYKHLVYSVPSTVPDSKTGPLIKRSIIQSTYMTVVVLCLLCFYSLILHRKV